jgi:2-C-methyl-D-erythritol 4-phosphate cytidylyltransferase
MRWGAVVVAAGRGTRLGAPKQFVELAGLPMVGWSIRLLDLMPEVSERVVVTEAEWLEPMRELAARVSPQYQITVVEGGQTRQQSAGIGLNALSTSCEAAFVHDGARPLVRVDDIRAGMQEVRARRGALLAAPVIDTVKLVDAQTMVVSCTLDRAALWSAQTPQFAMLDDFLRAHEAAIDHHFEATDDVGLLEQIGLEVVVVPGSSENFKVTLPEDVLRADTLLRKRVADVSEAAE